MHRAGIFALLLLAACKGEPDFDERYDKANQEIEAKADAIDAQLDQSDKETDNAGSTNPMPD